MTQQHSVAGSDASHGSGAHEDGAHETHGSLKEYVTGFVFSLVLTAIPLLVVLNHWLTGTVATLVLIGSAVLQFVVQLFYFMHLREEKKPRYNLLALILGIFVLITIVGGSIWIMTYNQVTH